MSISSTKLCFPEKVLDQHLVMLGKTGSGKSSKLRHIVEHLLSRQKRVCVVDPKGDWWGLKLAADGKRPGLPVILFGDFKEEKAQDVPINDRSGKHIAELVASGNRPCVIGMRGWTQGAMVRFWIDFAATLFAKNAGELYLVGDEFHNFAPKQWKGQSDKETPVGVALHWSNRLLSEGRGLGLVCLLASQRPQKVHNDTLTSCETLAALRVVHAADRAAIKAWIDGNGDPAVGAEVLASLANMRREESWLWSPEVGFGPKRVTFPIFTTFDSFAPPQLQKKVSSAGWADVNLDEVKEKLAAVIEEAKANDPAALRKELAEVRAELRKAHSAKPALAAAKVETKTVDKPVLKSGEVKAIERLVKGLDGVAGRVAGILTSLQERTKDAQLLGDQVAAGVRVVESAVRMIHQPAAAPTVARPAPATSTRPAVSMPAAPRPPREQSDTAPAADGDVVLNGSNRKLLEAAALWYSLGVETPERYAVGFLAGVKPSGGHFQRSIGPLVTGGLLENAGEGKVRMTPAELSLAPPPATPLTLQGYHDKLLQVLQNGSQRKILEAVIARGGDSLTIAEIGEATGMGTDGGHFQRSIGPLSTLGLIERGGGVVKPTKLLFPDGLKK